MVAGCRRKQGLPCFLSKTARVYLLINIPHRSVLDMCVSSGEDGRCTIDVTGQCIVRFKASPDDAEDGDSEKVDSAWNRSPLVRVHNFYKHLM